MPESVGTYRSLETAPKSPIERVDVNPAVAADLQHVIPQGEQAEAYLARKIGMSTGEATGTPDRLRVISPTGKRAHTLRFFRPRRVGNAAFTSLTAKGVGIGDPELETNGEEPFGLFGQKDAERELRESESLYGKGVRVSRVAAIMSLNKERLLDWINQQPKGKYSLEAMLRKMKDGEQPAVVVRFDNPRWSDLFSAKSRGPYSATAISRLGAQALFTEMDMAHGGDILRAVYQYPRSQEAQAALKEIMASRVPSQEALLEYLRLEAFFSGYNHAKLLQAGGKLHVARAAQDMLVGGALFTDFEGMNMGGAASADSMQAQRDEFAQTIAKMIVGRGFKALHISESENSLADMQQVFSQGFQTAA